MHSVCTCIYISMYLIAHLSTLKVPILSKVRLKRDKPPIQLEDKVYMLDDCHIIRIHSFSQDTTLTLLESLYSTHSQSVSSPSPSFPSTPPTLTQSPPPAPSSLLLHPLSLSLLPQPLPPFYYNHSHSVSSPSPSLPSTPPTLTQSPPPALLPFYSTHSHSVSSPSPSLPSTPPTLTQSPPPAPPSLLLHPLSLHLCNSGRHQLRFFNQRRGEGQ